ncbi:hypothetical protein DUI87_00739 [Hirundo rustica rustica]|uniref:Reverse transcriptase domain-containing protein n=1 Tax=Hirundo rustica rustica TaxID=333673 RepID=A0A3M0LAK6_HIRRU|nr:hypothetical protein DUI87_00739 [Hirundo rustica rustica]
MGLGKGWYHLTNLISFYEQVTSPEDEGKAVNVYLEFSKAFDIVSHSIFLDKLASQGLDRWALVTCGVLQELVFGPILIKIFIDDLHEINCTLSKFTDDSKRCGSLDLQERRKALQRDLDRLEQRAEAKGVRFNEAKCQILPLGHNNPTQCYRLGQCLESCPAEKGDAGQQHLNSNCAQVAKKAKGILASISKCVASTTRAVIVLL